MKTSRIQENFLLGSPLAEELFHGTATRLPILDYHCHLSAEDLAANRPFDSITELWITADPYKHRAMRIAGVPERCITGDASPVEKFAAWAATVPKTLGNPIADWTALELKRYFDIDEPLSPESSERIRLHCDERLCEEGFTARGLLAQANVELICTSDAPGQNLNAHAKLAASDFATRVLPSIRDARPEDAEKLEAFDQLGCRLADHAVDEPSQLDGLRPLVAEYHRRGWTLQLHLGAQRRTSSRLRALAGPAGGYASIGSPFDIGALCAFLDDLEQDGILPRVILFPLNPADFAPVATLTGSFAEDGVPGKIQFGPAWWFNDHAPGIRAHLETLSAYGLLPLFVGMTTDSRSLLSMVRHEYFRRLLCDFIGRLVKEGRLPDDQEILAGLVRAVCCENARSWLFSSPKKSS